MPHPILAVVGAALIGVSLGLLGSGGAILTVPILVYLLGHPEKQAIAESLFIVGAIALTGAVRGAFEKRVNPRAGLCFGVPGMVGAYAGAWLGAYVPGTIQLALLGAVMIVAAFFMARRAQQEPMRRRRPHPALLAGPGFGVGLLTGMIGVGGGFLIVPALVLVGGLTMPVAIGTSPSIIFVNCATGFLKAERALAAHDQAVDWRVVALFSVVGIVGAYVGAAIGKRLRQARLRQSFAVFLVLMAAFILWRQIPKIFAPPPVVGSPPTSQPVP